MGVSLIGKGHTFIKPNPIDPGGVRTLTLACPLHAMRSYSSKILVYIYTNRLSVSSSSRTSYLHLATILSQQYSTFQKKTEGWSLASKFSDNE